VNRASVRDLPALWPYRQRAHLVIACLDDPRELEAIRPEIEELGAVLVVEREAGPLSSRFGRPSVVVADRFGTVALSAPAASGEQVLEDLESFALSCPECGPQAWGDPGA
jgi:hypothetical protein